MLRFFLKYWDKLSLLEILENSLWSILKMMEKFYDTGKCGFFFRISKRRREKYDAYFIDSVLNFDNTAF